MRTLVGFAMLLIASSTPSFAQPPGQGSITGTIRYVGVVPPSQRVSLTDGQIILHNDIVVDPKTKGLRDVAVVLAFKEKIPANAKAMPVVIDQRDMLFLPRVVSVQEGQEVRFENNDLYNHGVTAQSTTPENAFNVITPAGRPYTHKFKSQKNPVPIGCALHSWMKAYVIVAAHPFHAVTGNDGKFRIAGVPAGKQTLQLVHPDTNYRERITVDVIAGQDAAVTVEWKKLR